MASLTGVSSQMRVGRTILVVGITLSVSFFALVPPVAAGTKTTFSAPTSVAIPDNGYDGTLASMAVSTISAAIPAGRSVRALSLEIGINHTWAGDLTIKLVSPGGSMIALVERPQGDGAANNTGDNGSNVNPGEDSDLIATFPLMFDHTFSLNPESMGVGLTSAQFVCRDDARCEFRPNRDNAIGSRAYLTDIIGEPAGGQWKLYVGDGGVGDIGTLVNWKVTIDHEISAVQTNSSTLNASIPDNGYNGSLASMASDSINTDDIPISHVVTDVTVEVGINHPWVGDLTIKLRSPNGTILTLMERPQGDGPANSAGDDGTSLAEGDSSDLSSVYSLVFNDGYTNDPEHMGLGIANGETVCRHDYRCRFFPNPDQAGGATGFAVFDGENNDGSWNLYVGDSAGSDLGTLVSWSITIKHALPVAPCSSPPFSDVAVTHPFCDEIKWMSHTGISNGFVGGGYQPTTAVTRQAMSAFLARLADAQLVACSGTPPFPDVPNNHPFCAEIKWMKAFGISTGFNDGTYRPSVAVTRQAMAAFMARLALPVLPSCATGTFVDVPSSNPFCLEIQWLKNTGISTGFDDGTFRPELPVTRQAMAAFMQRLSGLLP